VVSAGNPAEAQVVCQKDLQQSPQNDWSTFGLIAALEAQGKTEETATHREHFKTMWQFADVELNASRIAASPI
jgi:two-component SAPR family response regulator